MDQEDQQDQEDQADLVGPKEIANRLKLKVCVGPSPKKPRILTQIFCLLIHYLNRCINIC